MALTPAQIAELGGRMLDHAISTGTSAQIRGLVDGMLAPAKDFITNGSSGGFDQADRQEAMAAFRDSAFEADTGLDATVNAHEKSHWLIVGEAFD